MSSLDKIKRSANCCQPPSLIALNLTLSTECKIHTALSAATPHSASRAGLGVQAPDARFHPRLSQGLSRGAIDSNGPAPLVRKAGVAGALCSEAAAICISNRGPRRCPSAPGSTTRRLPPFPLTWLNLRPAEASEAVPGRARGRSLAERVMVGVRVGDGASTQRVFAPGRSGPPGTVVARATALRERCLRPPRDCGGRAQRPRSTSRHL